MKRKPKAAKAFPHPPDVFFPLPSGERARVRGSPLIPTFSPIGGEGAKKNGAMAHNTLSPLPSGERVRVRGKWTVLILLLLLPFSTWAIPLGVESGPHFFRTYPPAISAFIQLTNQAILYGNSTFFGDIPLIPLMSGGLGVRVAETLGEPFAMGLGFSLFAMETGTSGSWGAQEVAVNLGLSYADLQLLLSFSPLPGLLFLGASLGFAWTNLSYDVEFPSFPLSFVPENGQRTFSGRTFVAAAFLRAAWPILPNLNLGLEGGFRFALFPGLFHGDIPMDLNRDGKPDPLDLSGVWLGITLRVEFPL